VTPPSVEICSRVTVSSSRQATPSEGGWQPSAVVVADWSPPLVVTVDPNASVSVVLGAALLLVGSEVPVVHAGNMVIKTRAIVSSTRPLRALSTLLRGQSTYSEIGGG